MGDFNFPSAVGVLVGVGRYWSGRAAIACSVVSAILYISLNEYLEEEACISKDS